MGLDQMDDGQDGATAHAARVIGALADDLLPALVHRLDSSDLGELEVRTAAWRVRLRKPFDRRSSVAAAPERRRRSRGRLSGHALGDAGERHRGDPLLPEPPAPIGLHHHAHGPHGSRVSGTPDVIRTPGNALQASTRTFASAPVVGYFVPRDGYDIGRAVRAGEVVGWVDCLGVRQDVIAPRDTAIAAQLAQPGEAVEYGQPLFALTGGSSAVSDRAPEAIPIVGDDASAPMAGATSGAGLGEA